MEKTNRKGLKIALIILGVIIVLLGLLWFFVPRFLVQVMAKAAAPDELYTAKEFTAYSVTADNVQPVTNGRITVDIPAELVKKELEDVESTLYTDGGSNTVIIMPPYEYEDFNLFELDDFGGYDLSDLKQLKGLMDIKKGFEKLGNGIPENAFSAFKCAYTLSRDDYSFWDLNQGIAYTITGVLRHVLPVFGDIYVYETEDICGFVSVSENDTGEGAAYRVMLSIYSTDDLNTVNDIIMNTDTPEVAYAVINSAR